MSISAPSLQGVRFNVITDHPLPYFSKFIDDVGQEFRSVSVTFEMSNFYLSASSHLGENPSLQAARVLLQGQSELFWVFNRLIEEHWHALYEACHG